MYIVQCKVAQCHQNIAECVTAPVVDLCHASLTVNALAQLLPTPLCPLCNILTFFALFCQIVIVHDPDLFENFACLDFAF